jgi:hypothetical protein
VRKSNTKDKRFLFSYIIADMGHGSPQGKVGGFFANILPVHFELVPLTLIGTTYMQTRGLIP